MDVGGNKNDDDRVGSSGQKENNLPKGILLRSFLLINIRPSTGVQVSIHTHMLLPSLGPTYIDMYM